MKKLMVAAALLLSTGCTPPSGVRPAQLKTTESARLIVLADGVTCLIYSGYRKGGISCNWAKYNADIAQCEKDYAKAREAFPAIKDYCKNKLRKGL